MSLAGLARSWQGNSDRILRGRNGIRVRIWKFLSAKFRLFCDLLWLSSRASCGNSTFQSNSPNLCTALKKPWQNVYKVFRFQPLDLRLMKSSFCVNSISVSILNFLFAESARSAQQPRLNFWLYFWLNFRLNFFTKIAAIETICTTCSRTTALLFLLSIRTERELYINCTRNSFQLLKLKGKP